MAAAVIQYDRDFLLRLSSSKNFSIPPPTLKLLRHLEISKYVAKSAMKKKEASVEFCHLNVNDAKFETVRQLLLDSPNTILGLSESHLYPAFPMELAQISGYQCFRKDRVGKKGGGVLMYVPDYIRCVEQRPNQAIDYESLWVKCNIGAKVVLVACVYRPPDLPNGRTRQLLEDAESIFL